MAAAAFLVMGGWVNAKKAVGYVHWDLLLLIGSMLGISRSLVNSGLAEMIGEGIKNSGLPPLGALFVVYCICICLTEVMTNNAAAGLVFPLALSIAKKMVSNRP